jgi:hypothetical protein
VTEQEAALRLKIEELREEKKSFNIPQRYGVHSKGSLIGTRSLMNCLGVVIHNRIGNIGMVAHIEAQSDLDNYNSVVDRILKVMIEKLNENGGDIGSISVVLLGNAQSKVSVDRNIFGLRLCPLDFADFRGKAGGCILDPINETLWWDFVCANIADVPSQPSDTIHFKIQG